MFSRIKKKVRILISIPHYRLIYNLFKNKNIALLDIGCSGSDVFFYSSILPHVEYHGVDYQNPLVTEVTKSAMKSYYEINLETLNFSAIPDTYFDCVVMSHVIEHLKNSEDVIDALSKMSYFLLSP